MSENQKLPGRDAEKYIVRFKEGMRDEIKRRAAENCRSMNAEIIYLVQRGMEACHAASPAN